MKWSTSLFLILGKCMEGEPNIVIVIQVFDDYPIPKNRSTNVSFPEVSCRQQRLSQKVK